MKNNKTVGSPEQLIALVENRISELTGSVAASTDLNVTDEIQYMDPHGIMGEPGAIYTIQELKSYWHSNHDADPVLEYYDTMEEWLNDTLSQLHEVEACELRNRTKVEAVTSSKNSRCIVAKSWSQLISLLSDSGYEVDSAYRRSPDQWIVAYKDGKSYDIEVTRYSGGDYEVHPDNISEVIEADTDVYENDDIISDYKFVASKSVPDSDGFMTDYTWYRCADGTHVFVFGDNDIYRPEDGYFDYVCDSMREAQEWFNSYNGVDEDEADDDDIYSAEVFASSDIDALLSAAGGRAKAVRLIKDTKRNYPGIDDDELADMLENINDSLSSDEWLSVVEYLDM